jgi:hypothetical protein
MVARTSLMTRDEFREAVFARDQHLCVVCGAKAVDAHHIMERRLFPDGGYYLDNGASLCEKHHLDAERTLISAQDLRDRIGAAVVLPPHLYTDEQYDKWGNILLPNGQRLRGELFDDPSVNRVLDPVLSEFTTRVKYPRTWHLPWSPGATDDDRILDDTVALQGEIVMTLKMDGEQTTIYPDGHVHARSIDTESHPSRDYVRGLAGRIAHELPRTWRICGENLYAKHSIKYEHLDSYFQVFSIWENLRCLSWKETEEWCSLLGLTTVPVLFWGQWDGEDEERLHSWWKVNNRYAGDDHEGYVVRAAADFHFREFRTRVAKYVRSQHVQTHGHWMRSALEVNGLRFEGNPD